MTSKRKIIILVIDDDLKIRELIQAFFSLKSDEISCVLAIDVQQAILKMSNQDFDIVLIDNQMPGRTGLDYAAFLKKSIKYARLPIILMSGALEQEDVLKAIDGGLKDILVKPFTLRQLSDKIDYVLSKK